MEATPTIEQGRAAMAVARAFLLSLGAEAVRVQEADLGDLMGEVASLGRAVDAATVAVAVEAGDRGLPADSGPFGSLGGDLKAWVSERSPGRPAADVARLTRLVKAGRTHAHAPLLGALTSGRVDLRVADVCLAEVVRTRHYFPAEALPAVWEGFLLAGEGGDVRDIRSVRDQMVAAHGEPGLFQDLADVAAKHVSLSSPRAVDGPAGQGSMWAYRLVTDAEGKAVIEAAIGPLSKPQPGPDGQLDTRLPDRRRAEALVGMLRRGVTAGDDVPSVTKSQLILTASVQDLMERTGAGRVLGTIDPGLLAPETMRRISCDTTITPLVVGDDGDLLHLGRSRRLFSPAQLKALWVRDGGCTYPGCETPAHWADAHHLTHWADGGTTDLANAALLCGFHHTLVHQRRLSGALEPRVRPPETRTAGEPPGSGSAVGGSGPPPASAPPPGAGPAGPPPLRRIIWDTTPGSYDRALTRIRDGQPPAA